MILRSKEWQQKARLDCFSQKINAVLRALLSNKTAFLSKSCNCAHTRSHTTDMRIKSQDQLSSQIAQMRATLPLSHTRSHKSKQLIVAKSEPKCFPANRGLNPVFEQSLALGTDSVGRHSLSTTHSETPNPMAQAYARILTKQYCAALPAP